jgi:hypothetical protein
MVALVATRMEREEVEAGMAEGEAGMTPAEEVALHM